jgi:arginyl-tRNA synthetase
MNNFKQEIINLLKKELKLKEVELTIPPDPNLGDFAFPCFVLSKKLKKNPVEIAKELAVKIKPAGIIKEIKEAGPYLNFYLDKAKLAERILNEIARQKEKYGIKPKTKKIILVESPAPNTNKPLHLGHVRNMVLGTALLNLLNAAGNTAYLVNVNNDRGVHIAKSMLAYQKWGKNDSPEKSKMKSDHFVGKYYVMFAQKAKENPHLEKEALEMLNKWEQGDREIIALWKKMNTWALDGFRETYKKFNIKFRKEDFESETYKKGKDIIMDSLKKGLFKRNETGAVFVDLTGKNYGKKILLRADGTSVYITQDLYLAKKRYDEFKFDRMIYVVATEQNYHFNVLFEVLKMLKFPFADKCYHFAYGMVHLPSGRMKSREGTVVDADDIVADMEHLAKKETRKRHKQLSPKELSRRAEQLGMAAIRFYMLKFEAVKDMLFDPEVSISFEGETGPYLQYAHARICSIFRRHKGSIPKKIDFTALNSKQEEKLIMLLSQYPEIIADAAENYRPHVLCRYLLDLSQAFNEFYHAERILQAEPEARDARLYLIYNIKQVLKNGLDILGIEAPEGM